MSRFPPAVRSAAVARAKGRCEYCKLPIAGQVATFPIDHIVPRSELGAEDLSNLALACPHCNAHKWAHETGADPETGETAPLFNPRSHIWSNHFSWSVQDRSILVGQTAVGRATVVRLQMNSPTMMTVRQILIQLGLLFTDDTQAIDEL